MNLEENNGRTIRNLFSGFKYGSVAQLFLHLGNVECPSCKDYYCVTDFDILNSIIALKKPGSIICNSNMVQYGEKENNVYGKYSHKTKYLRIVRDCAWGLGTWKTKGLKKWLKEFSPDVIFFYSSDSYFSQYIAKWIRNFLKIPMVIYCVDDYYLKLKNSSNIIENFNISRYKRITKYNLNNSHIICINKKMADAYEKSFNKQCDVIYTSTTICPFEKKKHSKPLVLSYCGNISIGRYKSLIEIGKIIQNKNLQIIFNVYSSEYRKDILDNIKNINSLNFCGSISYSEVLEVMKNSDILLHVEDFSEKSIDFTRLSFSTKIADCLSSNRCLLCYAPQDIAVSQYLNNEGCSLVANNRTELQRILDIVCDDPSILDNYATRGLRASEKNHNLHKNQVRLETIFNNAINK